MKPRDWLALVVLAAAVLAVSAGARRAVWAALCGAAGALLALAAAVVERRRHLERPARQLPPGHAWRPARQLPPGHAWRVALFVEHEGTMRPLTTGTVSGPWPTAGDVEREAMARWVAANGWPTVGRLCARAEPVAVRAA